MIIEERKQRLGEEIEQPFICPIDYGYDKPLYVVGTRKIKEIDDRYFAELYVDEIRFDPDEQNPKELKETTKRILSTRQLPLETAIITGVDLEVFCALIQLHSEDSPRDLDLQKTFRPLYLHYRKQFLGRR